MSGKREAIIAAVMEQIETTITEQFERRLAALEAHITDLEERLNARGIFSGDGLCTVPGNPAHLWEDSRSPHDRGITVLGNPEAARLSRMTDAEVIEEVSRHAREPQH